MSSPSGVSDTGMGIKNFGEVGLSFVDELLQFGYLANLLERKDLILLVTINRYTSRVVTTVFKTGKAWGQHMLLASHPVHGVRNAPTVGTEGLDLTID